MRYLRTISVITLFEAKDGILKCAYNVNLEWGPQGSSL